MANRVILHLLGYNCNLDAGIGDQLKTLKCLCIRFYATLVIQFVLHYRFSAILVVNHFKFSWTFNVFNWSTITAYR